MRLSIDAVRFRTFLFTLPRHFHRPPPPRRAASSPLSPPTLRRRTDNASIPDAPTLRFYPVARFIDSSTPTLWRRDAPTPRSTLPAQHRRSDAETPLRLAQHCPLDTGALTSRRPSAPLNTARSTPTLQREAPRPPTPRRPRLSPAARPIDTDAPTSRRPLRPRHVCTPTSILDAPFYRRFDTRRPPDLPTLPAQLYARPPSHTLRRRPPYGTRTRVTTPKRRTFALRRRLRRRPPDFRPPSPPFSSSARTATEPRDRPT